MEKQEILTKLLKDDLKPALGVTEPGAIAYAVSLAVQQLAKQSPDSTPERVKVVLNSGIYKNAFTCAIPNSEHLGNEYAAALGLLGADPSRLLECLSTVHQMDKEAEKLISQGKVTVELGEVSADISIDALVTGKDGKTVRVIITGSHTHVSRILYCEKTIWEDEKEEKHGEEKQAAIHRYTVRELLDYVQTVPAEEIDFLMQAHEMNHQLFLSALDSPKPTCTPCLLAENGGKIISQDEQKTAALLCGGAIEARVLGLEHPAMSVTGSGAHGIIATLPLYAVYQVRHCSREELLRATALSCLICMYIKEYSGKLSAFCGCAIAAGTGAACGLAFLDGAEKREERIHAVINNMASSITGMICDGGNHGCVMKGLAAVDAMWRANNLARSFIMIESIHGINGPTPEETMKNMGRIASPGMERTEEEIVRIMLQKQKIQ